MGAGWQAPLPASPMRHDAPAQPHARKHPIPPPTEPYFNETGSNCPSILPRKQQMELLDLCVKSVQVGRGRGVTHE
jgi:hypothetical protein